MKCGSRILERVPDERLKGVIVKLTKKGNLTVCDHCREVSLLHLGSKVFTRDVLERFP